MSKMEFDLMFEEVFSTDSHIDLSLDRFDDLINEGVLSKTFDLADAAQVAYQKLAQIVKEPSAEKREDRRRTDFNVKFARSSVIYSLMEITNLISEVSSGGMTLREYKDGYKAMDDEITKSMRQLRNLLPPDDFDKFETEVNAKLKDLMTRKPSGSVVPADVDDTATATMIPVPAGRDKITLTDRLKNIGEAMKNKNLSIGDKMAYSLIALGLIKQLSFD